jgi:hypothetical protein
MKVGSRRRWTTQDKDDVDSVKVQTACGTLKGDEEWRRDIIATITGVWLQTNGNM